MIATRPFISEIGVVRNLYSFSYISTQCARDSCERDLDNLTVGIKSSNIRSERNKIFLKFFTKNNLVG